jgi:hypothetical protein
LLRIILRRNEKFQQAFILTLASLVRSALGLDRLAFLSDFALAANLGIQVSQFGEVGANLAFESR